MDTNVIKISNTKDGVKDEEKIVLNLGRGISIIVRNVRSLGADVLDDIAAAIVAIKMYLKSKYSTSKLKLRLGGSRSVNTDGGSNRNLSLWVKTWLKEAANEFDFNPYRRSKTLDLLYGGMK
jgi:hypothetical protein